MCSMRLIRRPFAADEASAAKNFIQLGHRQTAIEAAVIALQRQSDTTLAQPGCDPLTSELAETMRDWVTETLLQGAYLREYLLWEKDCKAYFAAMAQKNDVCISAKPKPGQGFVAFVVELLAAFSVSIPGNILPDIDYMRSRANTMKHDAGLELEHFITAEE